MAHSLTLSRTLHGPAGDDTPMQAYYMTVTAVKSGDMQTDAIFVIMAGSLANSDLAEDEFVCVADPLDLTEAPLATGRSVGSYYRVSEVILGFRNKILMEDTWQAIRSDVSGLLRALNNGANVPTGSSEEVSLNGTPGE